MSEDRVTGSPIVDGRAHRGYEPAASTPNAIGGYADVPLALTDDLVPVGDTCGPHCDERLVVGEWRGSGSSISKTEPPMLRIPAPRITRIPHGYASTAVASDGRPPRPWRGLWLVLGATVLLLSGSRGRVTRQLREGASPVRRHGGAVHGPGGGSG
jgi:hypothetical protein